MTRAKRIILATGSRTVDHWDYAYYQVYDWLEFEAGLFGPENVLVVEGGASGWDEVYRVAANQLGLHHRRFDADWDRYRGRKPNPAGMIRNGEMVRFVADLSKKYPSKPACWAHARDWQSGTGNCARAARKAGIPTTDFGVSTV